MLGGIKTICFAASYALALIFAVIHLFTRRNLWRAAAVIVLTAGVAAQTLFLYSRYFPRGEPFIDSAAGWFALLAWGLALCALWLSITVPKTLYMLFLLPGAFVSIFIGAGMSDTSFSPDTAARALLAIHTTALFGSALLLFVGLITGTMYIAQQRRLRRPRQNRLLPLPSLELLGRMLNRSTTVASGLLGGGIVAGYLMNHLRNAETAVPMTDLLVLGATILFVLLTAALVIARTNRSRSVRRVAIGTILCALILAVILLASVWDRRAHWYPRAAENSVIENSAAGNIPVENISSSEGGTP